MAFIKITPVMRLAMKKRLPPDTKVERYEDKTIYKYPSGKHFTERVKR